MTRIPAERIAQIEARPLALPLEGGGLGGGEGEGPR